MEYDFLGSAYINTCPGELDLALLSIRNQTLKPCKVILVVDGPLSFDIQSFLKNHSSHLNIKLLVLKQNYGLGLALRKGLQLCSSELILRFDTDDFNLNTRAEKQIKFIMEGNYDIISSYIYEYVDLPEKIQNIKKVPLSQKKIKLMLPFRNPFNHPAICFRLKAIKELNGGYRHFPFYEDYDLWIRALNSGLKCANIAEPLVGMNSNGLINRRINKMMFLKEAKLFKTFYDFSFIDFILFIPSFCIRTLISFLPKYFVEKLYKVFFRSKNS